MGWGGGGGVFRKVDESWETIPFVTPLIFARELQRGI